MTLTADQKRQAAQTHYAEGLGLCPARQLLETISSKWVTLVMLDLADGALRHSELRRRIPGASQKMLTSTLRSLERDGLVTRLLTLSVPVRTDYELTPLGHSLLGVIHGMKEWADDNMDQVEEARGDYDSRRSSAG
jgi:DNA-binding HxlR family transcriptional regulator